MKNKFIWGIFILATSMLSACSRNHQADDEEGSAPAPAALVSVQLAIVTRGSMTITVAATGRTGALRVQRIVSPVDGRIVALPFIEGHSIQSGATVARIETKESQSAVAGAEALLHSASTPRQKEEALRMMALAESSKTVIPVRAAFGGIISRRGVVEGDMVSEGTELLTLVDPASICFEADIPLSELRSVHRDQPCRITLQSLADRELRGSVDAILPQSDPASQSVKVRIRFHPLPNAEGRPISLDMGGEARIEVGKHTRILLVPRAALLHNDENDTYSVVTITSDSLSRSLAVIAIALNDSLAEIKGVGLAPGMEVITEGNYALPDSTRITVAR